MNKAVRCSNCSNYYFFSYMRWARFQTHCSASNELILWVNDIYIPLPPFAAATCNGTKKNPLALNISIIFAILNAIVYISKIWNISVEHLVLSLCVLGSLIRHTVSQSIPLVFITIYDQRSKQNRNYHTFFCSINSGCRLQSNNCNKNHQKTRYKWKLPEKKPLKLISLIVRCQITDGSAV